MNSLVNTIIILICCINDAVPFNYNVESRTIFKPSRKSTGKDSYFGYSTVLRGGPNPTIIVGAPRDYSQYEMHASIESPGAIYTCDVRFDKSIYNCFQKILDTNGNRRMSTNSGQIYVHRKDNMWLGMSLDATPYNNGSVVACAPRWSNQIGYDAYFGNGICYSYIGANEHTETLLPLINKDKQLISSNYIMRQLYGNSVHHYAYGQAGISTKLSEDGTELILGAPGVYAWTGTVIKYNIKHQWNEPDFFQAPLIPNPVYNNDVEHASYLGYSVGIGKFISNQNNLYVASAPRGKESKGAVFVFDFPSRENSRLLTKAEIIGEQIGEYFGATIATIDINQDGLSDLLIGAPMFANPSAWDQGRVYVYMNLDYGIFKKQDTPIHGLHDGGRFGSSISDIGDIDGDGYTDVAIGAPYENNGQGAVYIYLGEENGLSSNYSQRIAVDDMYGFGISISKGIDIDSNLCKDIAIGAYESESVVLLRCHPSVGVTSQITTTPEELFMNETQFTAHICFKFDGFQHLKTELDLKLLIDSDYQRAKLNDPSEARTAIIGSGGQNLCRDFLIDLKSKSVDYSSPVEIKLEYQLKNDPLKGKTFCADCTVLRPTASQEITILVPIASGCGTEHICKPDLKLKVQLLTGSPFVVGSTRSIDLDISLENVGEPAFLTEMQIVPSIQIPVSRLPPNCHLKKSVLLCQFENPLPSNALKSLLLEFDSSQLSNSDKAIEFNITTRSGGLEQSPEDNDYALKLPLLTVAKLNIIGKADPIQAIYLENNHTLSENVLITHSFDILNDGPTTLDSVDLHFFIPVSYFDSRTKINHTILQIYEPKATMNQQILICSSTMDSYYDKRNDVILPDGGSAVDSLINSSEYTPETTSQQHDTKGSISRLPLNVQNSLSNTKHINCTDTDAVTCLVFRCTGSKLAPGTNGVQIVFRMNLNTNITGLLLDDDKSLTMSTYAMADSTSITDGAIFNWAQSILVGKAQPASISIWIIILSIIIGLLILAIITYICYKINFFRRKEKENLELLKNREATPTDDDFGED